MLKVSQSVGRENQISNHLLGIAGSYKISNNCTPDTDWRKCDV